MVIGTARHVKKALDSIAICRNPVSVSPLPPDVGVLPRSIFQPFVGAPSRPVNSSSAVASRLRSTQASSGGVIHSPELALRKSPLFPQTEGKRQEERIPYAGEETLPQRAVLFCLFDIQVFFLLPSRAVSFGDGRQRSLTCALIDVCVYHLYKL